ncbi:MAG: TonB-dependent receptor [Bacteroidetes bacterium]|nr:TonB-dependent receptor [Bacteroidota bacterium]
MLNIASGRAMAVCLALLISASAWAQVAVTGRITDGSGKGLAGATISEKGGKATVVSDNAGGFRISVSTAKSVLVISYVGFQRKEYTLGSAMDVTIELTEDMSELGQVTVTASRQPVRKLEATQAVEIIGSRALKAIKPEGIAEAVAAVPGLYVNTSQGRRGGVVTRGFPDGGNPLGGLDYTAILIDGLPSFGTTGRLPEAGFGFDANVDRVEVVRGSTATLFGRASAAGAINVISKTGGTELGGMVKITNYNNVFDLGDDNFNYRLDFNLNGPLNKSKTLRLNLGGWFMDDRGYKNTGFNDNGYQIRGNLDYLIPKDKGRIRLYFLRADYVFQNLTDIPGDVKQMRTAAPYKPWQTLQNFDRLYDLNYTVYESGAGYPARRVRVNGNDSVYRNIRQSMNNNSYGDNFHVGTTMSFKLGAGFDVEEKFRLQKLNSGTKYTFALPTFYRDNSVSRLLLDGDAADRDIMNELRLRKRIQGSRSVHNLVLGNFFSTVDLNPTTYSFLHVMNPMSPVTMGWAPLAPPFVNVPWSGTLAYPRGSITRRANYTEQVTSIFGGDEMKFNDKLTINVGMRYDWVKIDMQETKRPYDTALYRNVSHKDWSASLGFNYLLSPGSAIYGSLNRAFRAPDYTAYTSLEYISMTNRTLLRAPRGINKNEVVVNTELGYRTTIGQITLDAAAFHTKINNRLASIFENGIVVSKPFGSNRIYGGEFSFTYLPDWFKGFMLRSNLTLQRAQFTEFLIPVGRGGVLSLPTTALNVNPSGQLFGNVLKQEGTNYSIDVKGKQLPGVPARIFNLSANYMGDHFGFDYSVNVNAKRYADPTQVIAYPNLVIMNAGAFWRVKAKGGIDMRVGLQAKNLQNNQVIQNIAGLSASDLALGQTQATPSWTTGTNNIWAQSYIQLPRRWLFYVEFNF